MYHSGIPRRRFEHFKKHISFFSKPLNLLLALGDVLWAGTFHAKKEKNKDLVLLKVREVTCRGFPIFWKILFLKNSRNSPPHHPQLFRPEGNWVLACWYSFSGNWHFGTLLSYIFQITLCFDTRDQIGAHFPQNGFCFILKRLLHIFLLECKNLFSPSKKRSFTLQKFPLRENWMDVVK